MKFFWFLVLSFFPVILYCQATESEIPFALDSDTDGSANIVDLDDDNDTVLDNDDLYPLDNALTGPLVLNTVMITSADAGLRNNSSNAADINYGSDVTAETKNVNRSFIMKFSQPIGVDLISATLSFYGDNENDPLNVYFLPNSNWDEMTITYNNTDFSGQQFIGVTNAPDANGLYTFDIPLFILPEGDADFTLWIYDNNDPSNKVERIFTKETVGKEPSVSFDYSVGIDSRLVIDQSAGTSAFVGSDPILLHVSLSQQPTSTVWVPFEISNPVVGAILGDQILQFDAGNWNVPQTLMIDPDDIGSFDIWLRPLHSDDSYFNGNNPDDLLGYSVQSTNVTNLGNWTIETGQTLNEVLVVVSGNGSEKFDFSVIEGPNGLNVVENSGRVTFSPLFHQIGTYDVVIEIMDDMGSASYFSTTITVTDGGVSDPVGIYVDLNADDDPAVDGSAAHPFHDIVSAVNASAVAGGGNVYLRGGEFTLTQVISIDAAAPFGSPVVIQPMIGEHVKFNYNIRAAFEFLDDAKNIVLQGVEIDGGTDEIDFWCIVAQALYGDESIPRGGGICIALDGDSITIKENYLHDSYQKAVEIRSGRYVDVYDNIIHGIATTSLSGGHGIMRQQKGDEFMDDDNLADYRWDIMGNLIFNVEQRIYSWVPAKGFMEMTLDEGKPILIDDPKDTDNMQEAMSARIKDNAIAFGSIDHIRLKSTPNLEVSNNSIYTESPHADGISDKIGDTNTPQFTNFIFTNNAAQTNPLTIALEVNDAIDQANANPGNPTISGNVAVGGSINPSSEPGLQIVMTNQLFIDPNAGNFRINPALGLPVTLGVDPAKLDDMDERAELFGVTVMWDGWTNDDLKLSQTILDNIPGVYDAISGNELVFTDFGTINADTNHLEFTLVDGDWKAFANIPADSTDHEFRLNEDYVEFYKHHIKTFKNESNQDYDRVRWGCSKVKQDYTFQPNWLTVSKIMAIDSNTVMEGIDVDFIIDGDLLVDFGTFVPQPGNSFDLITAANITSANTTDVFDFVQFEGYTPSSYLIEIVSTSSGQAVRLTILNNGCDGLVTNTDDSGPGSLREAIACVLDGDVVTISASLEGDTIKLTSAQLIIDKSISINSERIGIYVQNCVNDGLEVALEKVVTLSNFQILSNDFYNRGSLDCLDMIFKSKDAVSNINFVNDSNANLGMNNSVRIE